MEERPAALRFLCLFATLWLPLLILSLRFQAPEFRPWELLAEPEALRFAPSRKLEMDELGDLAAWSFVGALQTPRKTRFSTDRFGRRNVDADARPKVVVIGDSYVGGSGLPDGETVTARMSEALGEPVYNFAFSSMQMPALFLTDPRFSASPPQVVVWAPNQRNLTPYLLVPSLPPTRSMDEQLQASMARIELSSSLTRHARYALNGLLFEMFGRDDLVSLPDGTKVLRLPLAHQWLSLSAQARASEQTGMAIVMFERLLAQRGIRLVFAPIPDVGNIYPELYSEAERATITQPSMISLALAAARARGISVVDLQQLFVANRWPYLYRKDDSHWNERAVQLTANALSAAVRPSLPAVTATANQ